MSSTLSVGAALGRLAAAVVVFLGVEAALFRSGVYPPILEPDSSAGYMRNRLMDEIERKVDGPNQVVAVGHSRMALRPTVANELTPTSGYTFASISVAGAPQRTWYYTLRTVDPEARRYTAVIVPVDDYDEIDLWDDLTNWIIDLRYLVPYLSLGESAEFLESFDNAEMRREVVRGLLLKGLVYKRDVQDLLDHPLARLEKVKSHREGSASWNLGYTGEAGTLAGLTVDWEKNTISFPEGVSQQKRDHATGILLREPAPKTGRYSRYQGRSFRKIIEHYKGSRTRIIFIRLPRGPVVRPGVRPRNPESSVRKLAGEKNVFVTDEHYFESLERPELFSDALHLNGEGMNRFSKMLVELVTATLGPGR